MINRLKRIVLWFQITAIDIHIDDQNKVLSTFIDSKLRRRIEAKRKAARNERQVLQDRRTMLALASYR